MTESRVTEIKYSHVIRQNIWKKQTDQLNIVIMRKKLISPWNHTYLDYINDYKNRVKSKEFTKLKIGDIAVVIEAGTKNLLVVCIASELKKEQCDDIEIVKKINKICKCYLTHTECESCEDSVLNICKINSNEYHPNSQREPLYTFYRDIIIMHHLKESEYKSMHRPMHAISRNNKNSVLQI